MRWIAILLISGAIGSLLNGKEQLHVTFETQGSDALSQAMELLAAYHGVSYIYEEDVIPLSAFHMPQGFRGHIRRPLSLSFILDPKQGLIGNLEVLRQAIEDQVDTWAVRAQVMVVDGIPILVIGNAARDVEDNVLLGLARPRHMVGSYTPDAFAYQVARAQRATLMEMGIPLREIGISTTFAIRPKPDGAIIGDWANPREAVVALLKHMGQDRRIRSGYQISAISFRQDQGYLYSSYILDLDRRLRHPKLRAGGAFIHRVRTDLDLATSEILAKKGSWVFVARQRPAVLEAVHRLTAPNDGGALAGTGGVVFNRVSGVNSWKPLLLRMHLLPEEPLAENLERVLNNDRSISDACGPINVIAHSDGGHALYFGPGTFYDPAIHGVQQTFAQQIPAMQLAAGISLAAAVEMLYQALPETPKQALTLTPGAWQTLVLHEEVNLQPGPFGSVVCELFRAWGLEPGILRVHYDLDEKHYQFTYHASSKRREE